MSYKTYITEAFVCGSRASNTSDKSYLLFTRDAGMLYASAKSVREERSKHRYALQEFSYIRVTLVHGKAGWRITGTEPIANVYSIQSTREARTLVRNIIRLVRRLVQGEEAAVHVFDEVHTVLITPWDGHEPLIEEISTLRILHLLGYLAPDEALLPLVTLPLTIDLLVHAPQNEYEARKAHILHALGESHL